MPLLIAAGLIGVPLAIALYARSSDDEAAPETVDASQAYPTNHYMPGAGYYHAPFHAWFPFPYNSHQAGRGWFRGGVWRPAAQEDEPEREERARANGGSPYIRMAGSDRLGEPATSRPTPAAVQRANAEAANYRATHVTRGGFGSSARPGIS